MILVPDDRKTKTYTESEIQEIIAIALDRQSNVEFSSQHLFEIATELDIDLDVIRSAEKSWLSIQTQKQKDRESFRIASSLTNQNVKIKVKKSLGRYVAINSFLITLNALTNPLAFLGLSWSLLFLLGSGGFVFLRVWSFIHPHGEDRA